MRVYIVITLDGHYVRAFSTKEEAKKFVEESEYVCGVLKEELP